MTDSPRPGRDGHASDSGSREVVAKGALHDLRRDLSAEQAELDHLVSALREEEFRLATPSPGWNVFDQIAHLEYFDRQAALTLTDPDEFLASATELFKNVHDLDGYTLGELRQLSPSALLESWRDARERLARASVNVNASDRVRWYGPSMSARSFLLARLMETWAHGTDVASALGRTLAPTGRLIHVAQLGYLTRRWSYQVRGDEVPDGDVRVELTGPNDERWAFGPSQYADLVTGTAEEFCLVVTQRRHVDDTDLRCGTLGRDWLLRAQAFAGAATTAARSSP